MLEENLQRYINSRAITRTNSAGIPERFHWVIAIYITGRIPFYSQIFPENVLRYSWRDHWEDWERIGKGKFGEIW